MKETIRQRILRKAYPALMALSKWANRHAGVLENDKHIMPLTPFYDISITLINGETQPLKNWSGRKFLIVNTASDCGYTAQYEELQKLQEEFQNTLTVVGFPANDFKEQEQGSNEAVAHFCKARFGVSFPLAKKSVVVKSALQNEVFNWLSHSNQNGWNNKAPEWNFSKYLINENGVLTHYFGPAVSPLDKQVVHAIAVK